MTDGYRWNVFTLLSSLLDFKPWERVRRIVTPVAKQRRPGEAYKCVVMMVGERI